MAVDATHARWGLNLDDRAPDEGIDVFATASVRLWTEIAENDSQPWKQDMAKAAHMWRDFRSQLRAY